MLERGDDVPHFRVQTIDGRTADYRQIWQRRSLVLAILPESPPAEAYASALAARADAIHARGAEYVITREAVGGLDGPALVIADRWGEIALVDTRPAASDLASADDVLDWLTAIEQRCPECEGEVK